jgi:PAS domain S-box-containing protein
MGTDKATILLVDDQPDNLFVLCQIMTQYLPGCRVLTATDGEAGVAMAIAESPDAALIDMQMPGMDGIEMCRLLKARADTASVPVILMTAQQSTGGLRARGLDAGADDFIVRPIDNIELVARIRTVLRMKRAEDQLRARKAELRVRVAEQTALLRDYQRAVESSQDLIAVISRDFTYHLANEAFLQYYELAREQIFGVPVAELLGEECFAVEVKPRLEQAFAGETVQYEMLRLFPRLGPRYLQICYAPMNTLDGGVDAVVAIAIDITEKKRAEATLQQMTQQFEALLDGIPDALLLLTPERKVIWANRGAALHLQQAVEDLPGNHCYQLRQKRSQPCDNCPVITCFASGEAEEAMIATPDGRMWGVKAFPLTDAEGTVTSVIELATDITEKMRLREEAITASRLASLGELAAGVAHEINTPNAVILLNGGLIQRMSADILAILDVHSQQHGDFLLGGLEYSELREDLPLLSTELVASGLRIKRIVQDLKNFARPERSDLCGMVDLNAAVRAANRLVANVIRNSTSHFVVSYGEDLPAIRGSLQRIEQVLVNLFMNACQALPDTSKGVQVKTRYDAQRRMNVLEVQDEGVGILPENLPHVKSPFFSTRSETGGTGLGLSVSARIVEEHGGNLIFASMPGQGTLVTLSLPVVAEGAGS